VLLFGVCVCVFVVFVYMTDPIKLATAYGDKKKKSKQGIEASQGLTWKTMKPHKEETNERQIIHIKAYSGTVGWEGPTRTGETF